MATTMIAIARGTAVNRLRNRNDRMRLGVKSWRTNHPRIVNAKRLITLFYIRHRKKKLRRLLLTGYL